MYGNLQLKKGLKGVQSKNKANEQFRREMDQDISRKDKGRKGGKLKIKDNT